MSERPVLSPEAERRADIATDQLIGRLLQIGVATAAAVVVAGWAIFLVRHGSEAPDVRDFHPEATSVVDVVRGFAVLRARSLMLLGIVLLIATPVARVALTVAAFLRRRDGIFALLSAIVLLILLYGMFWSGAPL